MSETFRWGIVGPGQIARVFVESVRDAGLGVVAAVYGRSLSNAERFAERHGGVVAEDVAGLLATDGLDGVYIASPHSAHFAAARAALEAGKPVLCEKPLTTHPEATAELTELSRDRGVPLVEGWMYRTHPQLARLLSLVAEGSIGRVRDVEAHFGFEADYRPRHRLWAAELGGGGVLDVGGYPVSFALAVARAVGEDPHAADLEPIEGELAETGVDRVARALLKFSGGLEARVHVRIDRELGSAARVIGDRGQLSLEHPFLPEGERRGKLGHVVGRTADGPVDEVVPSEHDCFALEARELIRLARADGEVEPRAPMVDHAETVTIARLLEAWRSGVGATPAPDPR